jgi:hypothetical protein
MGNFRSFSISTMGASHKTSGTPCQDSSRNNDGKSDIISAVVVSDGHGSPHYFRSNKGSEIAAQAALDGIAEFAKTQFRDAKNEGNEEKQSILGKFRSGNGQELVRNLAKHIISEWFSKVEDDNNRNPVSEDKVLDTLVGDSEKYRERYRNDSRYFYHAYGATLIATALAEDYWFGFHIGDGKCVALYQHGTDDYVWEQPIPWDDRCFLNATTSICDKDTVNNFRYWFGYREEDGSYTECAYGIDGQNQNKCAKGTNRPIAVFINSDGVDDTYSVDMEENKKQLMYLYRNVFLTFSALPFDEAKEKVSALADRFAAHGSQDDVSIAGVIGDLKDHAVLIEHMKRQAKEDKRNEEIVTAKKTAESKRQMMTAEKARYDKATHTRQKIKNELDAVANECKLLGTRISLLTQSRTIKEQAHSQKESIYNQGKTELAELSENLSAAQAREACLKAEKDSAKKEMESAQKEAKKCKCAYDCIYKQQQYKVCPPAKTQIPTGQPETVIVVEAQLINPLRSIDPSAENIVLYTKKATLINAEPQVLDSPSLDPSLHELLNEANTAKETATSAQTTAEKKESVYQEKKQKWAEADKRLKQLEKDEITIEKSVNKLADTLNGLRREIAELNNDIEAAQKELDEKRAIIKRRSPELSDAEKEESLREKTYTAIKAAYEKAEQAAAELEKKLKEHGVTL